MKRPINSSLLSSKTFLYLLSIIVIVTVLWNFQFYLIKSNEHHLSHAVDQSKPNSKNEIVAQKSVQSGLRQSKSTDTQLDELVKVRPIVKNTDDKFHVVFSTDCTFFQDWQSIVVFHR